MTKVKLLKIISCTFQEDILSYSLLKDKSYALSIVNYTKIATLQYN